MILDHMQYKLIPGTPYTNESPVSCSLCRRWPKRKLINHAYKTFWYAYEHLIAEFRLTKQVLGRSTVCQVSLELKQHEMIGNCYRCHVCHATYGHAVTVETGIAYIEELE